MADYDVMIVGGGPVGAALALAMHGANLTVGLLEGRAAPAPGADPRPIALSHGSRLILERLGIWEQLQPATPILRIHVSQQGGFGRVELSAGEARLPALGYVVDYAAITAAMASALEAMRGCRVIQGQGCALEGGAEVATARYEFGSSRRQASARLLAVAD